MTRIISTHAREGTVLRWASCGSKRLRAKYRHAITVCRVARSDTNHGRDAPIVWHGRDRRSMTQEERAAMPGAVRFLFGTNAYVRRAVSTVANRERPRRWDLRPHRRAKPWRLPTLGWYGGGSITTNRSDRPLECWADLRGWLRSLARGRG